MLMLCHACTGESILRLHLPDATKFSFGKGAACYFDYIESKYLVDLLETDICIQDCTKPLKPCTEICCGCTVREHLNTLEEFCLNCSWGFCASSKKTLWTACHCPCTRLGPQCYTRLIRARCPLGRHQPLWSEFNLEQVLEVLTATTCYRTSEILLGETLRAARLIIRSAAGCNNFCNQFLNSLV